MFILFRSQFDKNETPRCFSLSHRQRRLRLEHLEERQMLSVSPGEFAQIRTQYPDLNLSANFADYNVIEITAAQLSDTALRDAIANAGTTTQNDLIVVRTTDTQNAITLAGLELAITSNDHSDFVNVTIVSLGTKNLTIDANRQLQNCVLNIRNCQVQLGGINITGGYADGVWIDDRATLTMTDCTISGNSLLGISNHGTLTITHCTISDNTGGGIDNYHNTGNSNFYLPASVTVTDSIISGNTGNGIYNYYYNVSGDNIPVFVTVTNCIISGNSGHGIFNYCYADSYSNNDTPLLNVMVTNSTISGNSGNGIHTKCYGSYSNYYSAFTMMVTNGSVTENTGAGIFIDRYGSSNSGCPITVENSVISGIVNDFSILTMTNCTIPGGITGSAPTTIKNSIVTGPVSDHVQGSSNLTPRTDWNGNFIYDPALPMFVDAANGDYRLLHGSPAIDAGDNALAVDVDGNPLTTDLAGKRRSIGTRIDLGAYEFQGSIIVVRPDDHLSGVPHIDNLNLREALLLANKSKSSDEVIVFDSELFDKNGIVTVKLSEGELVITNSITIIGTGVTIDAISAGRVFYIDGGRYGCDVELIDFTLTGGNTDSQGGAIYARNVQLALTNVECIGNTAKYGGAMFLSNSIVTMTDVTMTGNTGIWGGAIYQIGGDLTIHSGSLTNNTAKWGGGLYQATDSKATLTEKTVIINNTAKKTFGSAVVKSKGASLTIKNNVFDQALARYLDDIERFL